MRMGRRRRGTGGACRATLWGVVALLVTLSVVPSRQARAQAAGVQAPRWRALRLEYRPEAGVAKVCPSEETFRLMVQFYTRGVDPFQADAAETLRVVIDLRAPKFHAQTAVIRPDGTMHGTPEEEDGASCGDVARDAAETAYLIVEPVLPLQTVPVPNAEPVSSAPAPAPLPAPQPAPWAPPPSPPERLGPLPPPPQSHCSLRDAWKKMDLAIGLSGFLLMSAGYTENVSPGLQLGVDLRAAKEENDLFRLGVEFRGFLPSRAVARESYRPGDAKLADPSRWREADTSLLSVLVVPCVRWKYFLGCGVFENGLITAQFGADFLKAWTYTIGPRVGVEIPFAQRFAVRGFGEALFAPDGRGWRVIPPPGETTGPDVQWSRPVVSAFFGAGFSVKFE